MMTHMNAKRHQWINMFVNGSIKLVWGQRFYRCATKINQLARNAYCMCSIVNYIRSFQIRNDSFEINTCRQKVYIHHFGLMEKLAPFSANWFFQNKNYQIITLRYFHRLLAKIPNTKPKSRIFWASICHWFA